MNPSGQAWVGRRGRSCGFGSSPPGGAPRGSCLRTPTDASGAGRVHRRSEKAPFKLQYRLTQAMLNSDDRACRCLRRGKIEATRMP